MEEIIFPNEPVDIGTPWKHKYVYPEEVDFIYFLNTDLIFKIQEDWEPKFTFSGFIKNGEFAKYSITTPLPKFYCREVKLNE